MSSAGFVTFRIFELDAVVADRGDHRLVAALADWGAGARGLRSARVHLGLDRPLAAIRAEWSGENSARAAPDVPLAGVRSQRSLSGIPAAGLTGPDPAAPGGVAAIAVRHLGGPEDAAAVLELLAASGSWKRRFDGFVSAQPCVSRDGRTLVNYPMWTRMDAYEAWMADPRVSEGQEEIARHEVAPAEYLLFRVVAEAGTPANPLEGSAV